MITAVDTNIILDVLIPGEPFGKSSKKLLDHHLSKGKLIICEVVFAELAARFLSRATRFAFDAPGASGYAFRESFSPPFSGSLTL